VTIGDTRFQSRDETRSHADHIGAQHLRCGDIAPRGNPTGELDDAVKYGADAGNKSERVEQTAQAAGPYAHQHQPVDPRRDRLLLDPPSSRRG
jgi:hypothetical protein